MPELQKTHPEVTWAQRSSSTEAERNYIYLTIKAPDVPRSDAKLNLTPTNVSFEGPSKKGYYYTLSLDLFAEIDTENSKVNHNEREVALVLRKKELKEEFWPRLTKDKQKLLFLKTDFDKWVDEDEQDEVEEDDPANNFAGMGGEDGGLGGIDFSKLQGMQGMEGLGGMGGMPGMEGLGGAAGGEEGEDEMPELEETEKDEGAEGSGKSKIQEVS